MCLLHVFPSFSPSFFSRPQDDDADDVDTGYRAKITAAAESSAALAGTPAALVAGNGTAGAMNHAVAAGADKVNAAVVAASAPARKTTAGNDDNDDGPSTKKARLTALYNGPSGTGAGPAHR